MEAKRNYHVMVSWDADASVWVATGANVKGLSVHGRTREELIEKITLVLPELVMANEGAYDGGTLTIDYLNETIPLPNKRAA